MKILASILSQKRYLGTALVVFFVYVIIYLLATQFLVLTERSDQTQRFFALKIADNWQELLFRQRAPFLFESVAILYLGNLKLFISFPNILLAKALGILVALNLVVAYYSFRSLGLKGGRGFLSLLGTLPAIVSGAACCVPTLILVIGLQFTAALAALWPFFVPLSFLLLGLALWWSLSRLKKGRV